MSEKEALVLMLMSIGAFFMPFTSKRLMLPSAVGEMIYGIILGIFIPLGSIRMPLVDYFSTFGFLLLMYLAGLELDFERFKKLSRADVWLFFLTYLPVAAIALIISLFFELHWVFVLIFFTTGIGLLFPVLRDTGLLKSDFGQKLLIVGVLGEILTLLGLTITTITYKYGLNKTSLLHISMVLLFLLGIYLFMKLLRVGLWWRQDLQSLFLKVGNSTETGMRANFVILFAFVAFAGFAEVEFVVGAFAGGMILALVFFERQALLEKLSGVGYGFFIPIFFISVGMRISLGDFLQTQVIMLALIITGALFLTRLFGTFPLYFSSLKKSSVILVALGLSFPLTILVAVGSICYDAGIISKSQSSAILIASMISAIIYPWLFKLLSAVAMPDNSQY